MARFRISELKRKARAKLGDSRNAEEALLEENTRLRPSYDIFISHSFRDAEAIYGIKVTIEEMGYKVYVDWINDSHLDRNNVTKDTAELLKDRMRSSHCLFYVTSENANNSRWMPWELGYFDGLKAKVAILPIREDESVTDTYKGPAYLGLYPYVTKAPSGKELRIHNSEFDCSDFEEWLGSGKYILIEGDEEDSIEIV